MILRSKSFLYYMIGAVFLALGITLAIMDGNIKELEIRYDQ